MGELMIFIDAESDSEFINPIKREGALTCFTL